MYLITLLICSLYNLLVFAVPCQFVIDVTLDVSCSCSCPALPCPVLSSLASCPVFPLRGSFCCFVLFYCWIKNPFSCTTESSLHPSLQNPDSTNWPTEDSAEMGIFLFPSPTTGLSTRQLMVQHVNARYFRQQGADVRDFACDFLIEVDSLDYSEADVKEVLTSASISLSARGRWRSWGILASGTFVYHVFHHEELEPPPQAKSHSTDCSPIPPAVSGSPSPPMTQKRRRSRKNGPASAPPEAADNAAAPQEAAEDAAAPQEAAEDAAAPQEAAEDGAAPQEAAVDVAAPQEAAVDAAAPQEAAVDAAAPQEAADEAAAPPMEAEDAATTPVEANDAIASRSQKRRRRRKKASSIPQGRDAIQELTAGQQAVPEPPKLLALPAPPKLLALPAPPKLLALPAPPRFLALPAPPRFLALPAPLKLLALPAPPKPPDVLEPTWSVPPAPPWPSSRVPVWPEPPWFVPPAPPWPFAGVPVRLEPPWSVPPAPPWPSSRVPVKPEPPWSVPPAPPWWSAGVPVWPEPRWVVPPAPPWPPVRTLELPEPPWLNPPAPPWAPLWLFGLSCWHWLGSPPSLPPSPLCLCFDFLSCLLCLSCVVMFVMFLCCLVFGVPR